MSRARSSTRSHGVARTGRDFLFGLALFALVATAAGVLPQASGRSPAPLFSTSAYAAAPHASWALSHPIQSDTAVYGSTDRRAATVLLGLSFAALLAFNLAVLRHLRRVYASPR